MHAGSRAGTEAVGTSRAEQNSRSSRTDGCKVSRCINHASIRFFFPEPLAFNSLARSLFLPAVFSGNSRSSGRNDSSETCCALCRLRDEAGRWRHISKRKARERKRMHENATPALGSFCSFWMRDRTPFHPGSLPYRSSFAKTLTPCLSLKCSRGQWHRTTFFRWSGSRWTTIEPIARFSPP